MALVTRREVLGFGALALLRAPGAERRPVVRPEYERSLEKALVLFPDGSRDTDATDLSRFLEVAFGELRTVLPSYTKIDVAGRREGPELGGARFHRVEDPDVELELWAQDVGEPVFLDGRERFLVAAPMPPSMGGASRMSVDRKRVAQLVFGEAAVVEAPFVFEGGNLAFDEGLVLVGRNDVSRTIDASGDARSRRKVLEDVASTFGGAEIVEMGVEPQSPLLQHLDQVFALLDGRVAVVCRLQGGGLEDEERQLRYYADQLRDLGYRISFLDHGASDLTGYRSSINVVPFFDREAGRKRVLLPIFPGELREEATVVDRKALLGKAARAFDLYRDLGYEPSPLRDVTHPLGGSTHCILNVLS
jgi:hypothetical protein